MFAVLQPLDAELLILGRDRSVGGAGDRNVRREIDAAARQRLGELEARARRSGFVIDFVVENAKAVLLAQPLIGRADVGHVVAGETGTVSVERRPPLLALGVAIGEDRQRCGFVRLAARADISGVSRRRGLIAQLIGRPRIRGRRQRGSSIGKPIGCTLRIGRNNLRQRPGSGCGVVARRGRDHILPNLIEGLLCLALRVFAHLRLKTNRVARQLLVRVSLLLGQRRREIRSKQGEERKKDAADEAHEISPGGCEWHCWHPDWFRNSFIETCAGNVL